MENEDNEDIITSENNDEIDLDLSEDTEDTTDKRPSETPEAKLARLDRQASQLRKKLGIETEKKVEKTAPSKTETKAELDETQLDYLDLKGITESEDITIIENIVKKTGMTVRQALKDDYVLSKLDANKADRDVKSATPSSTKRGGSQTNDVASALAKFDQTGELPDDFTLRSEVINATVERNNTNKPSWH